MTRNKEYWIARALQRENEAYLRGVGLTAKMFQEYDRAAKAIRRDIGDFYSKYAGKYGLTYDQAVRLLTRKEFQEWKATLGEYITRIAAEPDPRVKALLTAQLDALSTNSRISRLEALLGQIDLKLNELWETGVSQMKAEFGETFREGYYKKVYDIQSRAGFIHEFAKLDESVVENVLSYPGPGLCSPIACGGTNRRFCSMSGKPSRKASCKERAWRPCRRNCPPKWASPTRPPNG